MTTRSFSRADPCLDPGFSESLVLLFFNLISVFSFIIFNDLVDVKMQQPVKSLRTWRNFFSVFLCVSSETECLVRGTSEPL